MRFIAGDNLTVMQALHSAGERFHLIYIDPPYNTGRDFLCDGEPAFSDRWPSLTAYLDHLRPRLQCAAELLAPEGSLVVHVDPSMSHHVRLILDGIMGADRWCDEVAWRYRRWPSKTRRCQRVHDVLLRYALDPTAARWTQLYEPPSASTLATWGHRKQRAVTTNGKRVRSEAMAEESPGVPIGDVWDIGIIAPMSHERTGFPTQKPEALLDRAVRLWSQEGDHVLEPYAGSATCSAVAERLGRHAVAIDDSPAAARVIAERFGQRLLAP